MQISFSGDGNHVAALGSDRTSIRVWDLSRNNALRRQFNHDPGAVNAFALSPDGKLLATSTKDGKAVLLWNVGRRDLTHKGPPLDLSAKDLASLWADLGDADNAKSDAAWHKLAAAGDNAIAFLQKQIRSIPVPNVDMTAIEKLAAELDSEKFAVREHAQKELAAAGEMAIVPLQRLLESRPSNEAVTRANLILTKLPQSALTPDRLRVLDVIELLEAMRTAKAIALLREIHRDALIAPLRTEAQHALRRIK